MDKDVKKLMQSESEQLVKLKIIVQKAMDDEKLIIQNLLNPQKDILTKGQKYQTKWPVLAEAGRSFSRFL